MVFSESGDELSLGRRMEAPRFFQRATAATRQRESLDARIVGVVASLDVTALDHQGDDLERAWRAHPELRRQLRETQWSVGEGAKHEAERRPEIVEPGVCEVFVKPVLECLESESEEDADVLSVRGRPGSLS